MVKYFCKLYFQVNLEDDFTKTIFIGAFSTKKGLGQTTKMLSLDYMKETK